jgi:hypothetical protein
MGRGEVRRRRWRIRRGSVLDWAALVSVSMAGWTILALVALWGGR